MPLPVDPGRTLEAQLAGAFLARTPSLRLLVLLGGTEALPVALPRAWQEQEDEGARADTVPASTSTKPYCDLTGLPASMTAEAWGQRRTEEPPPFLVGAGRRAAAALVPVAGAPVSPVGSWLERDGRRFMSARQGPDARRRRELRIARSA